MTNIKSFPHYTINVKDNSIYNATVEEILPVHRAFWILRTQEGPVGHPTWCPSYSRAKSIFGAATFDATSKYFSMQSQFLLNTLTYNGAFICRAADSIAKKSICILEAFVAKKDIPQFERDVDGSIKTKLDPETGMYVPIPTGTTEPGISITYKTRSALLPEETAADLGFDELKIRNEGDSKIYPILVLESTYVGEYGNDLALQLFYNSKANPEGDVNFYKTLFYSFAPVRRQFNSTSVDPIFNIFNQLSTSFAANPKTVDPSTKAEQSMEALFAKAYKGDAQLPYTIYTYESNIQAIGLEIIAVEDDFFLGFEKHLITPDIKHRKPLTVYAAGDIVYTNDHKFKLTADAEGTSGEVATLAIPAGATSIEDGEITWAIAPSDITLIVDPLQGFLANVISGINLQKIPYPHVEIIKSGDDNVVLLAQDANIYLDGGTDGDISDASVGDFTRQFLAKKINPRIVDKFYYPITHMYDAGFSMKTKFAMIDFLDIRDDIMLELSTQTLIADDRQDTRTIAPNAQDKDESNGEALRSYALLFRESIAKGTDCCRCAIYCHTGKLAAGVFTGYIPFTFWSAMKHAQLGNLTYMRADEPRGWPGSYNEFFKVASVNWINYDEAGQERVWTSGLTYCQAADMTRIFYPALRTVYRAETSVLVDQWFVDAVVYTKHVVRKAWAKHSGRNDNNATIQNAIKLYLDTELSALYGGKYTFEVSVYQTEEEAKLGYVQHVLVSLTSPATNRVLNVDIEVNREGFSPEE